MNECFKIVTKSIHSIICTLTNFDRGEKVDDSEIGVPQDNRATAVPLSLANMETFNIEEIEDNFVDMEFDIEDMATRMEDEFEAEMNDQLPDNFTLAVEPNSNNLEMYDTLLPGVLDETAVEDESIIQAQSHPSTCDLQSSQSTQIAFPAIGTTTGTRYAMLRKALLDPVKEWRNLPDVYRNDKLFILQFLHKLNLHQLPLPSKDDFERKFPYYLRQDRDIIDAISQRYDFSNIYTTRHSYVPEQYKDDKSIMMTYCKTIKRSLQECSYRLQDDIDIVTTALQNDGMELQYASSALQENEMIVRRACHSNICALDFCSSTSLRNKLLGDCDFVTKMIRTAGESGIHDVVVVGGVGVDDPEDSTGKHLRNRQMEYARKILRTLVEPLRSNKDLWLLGIQYNILSYTELSKHTLKYQNDIEFLIESISRRSSVYLELCQIPSKEQWYKSTATVLPITPGNNSCGGTGICDVGIGSSMHDDCHRIAYTTITSSTSDATIIAKVLENIPTFLASPEYKYNALVHQAIVDRAALPYIQIHLKTNFPYLLSNVEIMTRAIQRDCNLFVACTEKDEPAILIAAMNMDTAYPLLRTKPMDYVLEHIDDVLLHVINVSKTYNILGPIIPDHVWNNNIELQKAWIKRKGSLLPSTVHLLNCYSTNNIDTQMNSVIYDLAQYIAEHNSHQFVHVPLSLRSDVNFMLSVIQLSSGIVMQHGCVTTIQRNIECAIYTIAYAAIGRAFDYIRYFTPRQINDHIQTSLSFHDSFVNPILCTICQTEYGRNDLFTHETRTITPLQILNCGPETSAALLERIALFVGLPIGPIFTIYEKAHRIVYQYLHRNFISSTTTTNEIAATDRDTNRNTQPPPQPPVGAAVEPATAQNAAEFRRFVDRLRQEGDARPAFHRDHPDDDEENEIMELEEIALAEEQMALGGQLDQLPANNGAAVVADPAPNAPNQQPIPDVQLASEIERFVLANAVDHNIGHPPEARVNDLLPDPLLRLRRLHEHRAIIRTIRRRRLRNNNGQPNI